MAHDIGYGLAHAGFSVVTGGGGGIMEAASLGAREAGGRTIGCTIALPGENPNGHLSKRVDFSYFFVRKVMLVKYATAFVLFPGGFGTLDEFFETITLMQTGKIRRFPMLLIGPDYWPGLVEWMEQVLIERGMIAAHDRALFHIVGTPEEVVRIVRETQETHGTHIDNVSLA
jgi:uncharacterized protein (TIGR00730 family)